MKYSTGIIGFLFFLTSTLEGNQSLIFESHEKLVQHGFDETIKFFKQHSDETTAAACVAPTHIQFFTMECDPGNTVSINVGPYKETVGFSCKNDVSRIITKSGKVIYTITNQRGCHYLGF